MSTFWWSVSFGLVGWSVRTRTGSGWGGCWALQTHLMNLSNTAAQSEPSLSTSVLLLRPSSISSNTALCRESTREWAWNTFTSSALGVSTRRDTSLPLPWTSRASRRCTTVREWLMVSPLLPPSCATSTFSTSGERSWSCDAHAAGHGH